MNYDRFIVMMNNLNEMRKVKINLMDHKQIIDKFIDEFGLLDFRDFREASMQTTK
jgi:ureidoacrylate peracid hydrolase